MKDCSPRHAGLAQQGCTSLSMLALSTGMLLQALISIGEPASTGSSIIELVAGSGAADGSHAGFARYFTPAELGQLLELERQAVVHAKGLEQ